MPRRKQCTNRSQRKLGVQSLESRRLLAADSIGVTPDDTGEYLVGSVVVTPVFFDSNGETDPKTQNWDAGEIDEVLLKITEGVNWWSRALDTLDTVHTLDFIIDDTFAQTPVQTPYESIDRSSSQIERPISEFLEDRGYGDLGTIDNAIRAFNRQQRDLHQADWAFTIFIADSSDDPDGLFASGGSFAAAFAFPGGLFMVSPSGRPASTFAHEMGHIFWARDEYPGGGSWTDTRGYYNGQNLNAHDNPTPGFVQQNSIMRGGVPLGEAYEALTSPASTLAMVGWQDSDGDGVFDFADVPLHLEGLGTFDSDSSIYTFDGRAEVVPLRNLNSAGPQSDIALGQLDQLQYRLDGGPWQVATEIGQQRAELLVNFSIETDFDRIELRVIDTSTGITSPSVFGTMVLPAVDPSSVAGAAFLDTNGDGVRTSDEELMPGLSAKILHADGRELFNASIAAADFGEGKLPMDAAVGLTLAADGLVSDPDIGVSVADDSDDRFFESYDLQRSRWTNRFSDHVALVANLGSPVGQVQVTVGGLAVGSHGGSYARVETYDANGNFLTRRTSDLLADGESLAMTVEDPQGRIQSFRVFGHAGTSITVSAVSVGTTGLISTESLGVIQFTNLPAGEYQLEITPELVIHDFATLPDVITIADGSTQFIEAGAIQIDSPRFNVEGATDPDGDGPGTNTAIAHDVNGDGNITSRDALIVINDMTRFGSRALSMDEADGFYVDVNNDGRVTAVDALLVINRLGDASGEGESTAMASNEDQPDREDQSGDAPMIDSSVATDTAMAAWESRFSHHQRQQNRDLMLEPNSTKVDDQEQMFNLAGSSTADESIGPNATDSQDRGRSKVFPNQIRPPGPSDDVFERPLGAGIAVNLEEPFGHRTV